ncbi:RnfABCDGE type electron transport complex subunit G [Ilyobacter sp.]|uniref:RnfABCDGE type electron transport complex subunit G n=1 Tax=Ilyobacter sp. TaxID=3100343 RepID=UPI0035636BAA
MMNRFVHYGLVLLSIAAISAGILASVNNMTKDVIAANAKKAVNEARIKVLPGAVSFNEEEKKSVEGLDYVPGYSDGGEIVGYVVTVAQPGYAANINFVLGFGSEGEIKGLNIIGHQETPGLGSKVSDPEWQSHWIGKKLGYEFNKSTDAFAGATISPQAVYTGMMKALSIYETEVKN